MKAFSSLTAFSVKDATSVDVLKTKFLPTFQENSPGKSAALRFQDIAPDHRKALVQQLLTENFEVVHHNPYSPDLDLAIFFFFLYFFQP